MEVFLIAFLGVYLGVIQDIDKSFRYLFENRGKGF